MAGIEAGADGLVDVGIAAPPIAAEHLTVEPTFDEELLLVTAADHPLARKPTVRASDLVGLTFMLLGEMHCLSDQVASYCRQRAYHPLAVERTSQLSIVQELLAW